MALNFPNSPTDGQIYTDTATGYRWVWDSGNTTWKSTSTYAQTITVSSTQPGSPVIGQLWWNNDYGRLFVYYSDGDSSQWVDASPNDFNAVAAFRHANAGFTRANTALQNTSGTFAGDLSISGTANVASNMRVGANLSFDNIDSVRLWEPSANTLTFHTASTERMRIDANGNVGVGTTNTVTKLVVQGDNVPSVGQVSIRTLSANNYAQLSFFDRNRSGLRIFQDYTDGSNLGVIINDAGNAIQLSNIITRPGQPMFYGQHNASGQASNRYGHFSTEYVNQGNFASHGLFGLGYTHTRFTCPVAGRYMVWVGNIGNPTGTTQRTYVYKNGSSASAELRTAQTGNHGTSASMTAIINCAANDWIACLSLADDGSSGFYSGIYSHMGVILIG